MIYGAKKRLDKSCPANELILNNVSKVALGNSFKAKGNVTGFIFVFNYNFMIFIVFFDIKQTE